MNTLLSTTTVLNKRYKVLIIDPPWHQGKTGKRKARPNQTTTLDYPTMSKEKLLELPVGEWADAQSFLWLWATNSKDRETGQPILKIAFELIDPLRKSYASPPIPIKT